MVPGSELADGLPKSITPCRPAHPALDQRDARSGGSTALGLNACKLLREEATGKRFKANTRTHRRR
jgi:hypothetical protein